MKKYLFLLLAAFIIFSCSKSKYDKLDDGIVIHLNPTDGKGAKQVKLQVVSDKVIHVTSSATDTFSTAKSLIILEDLKNKAKWNVTEKENEITLATSQLKATISLTTGEVIFTDTTGNVILQEK